MRNARAYRSKNLIFFNIPELDGASPGDRLDHDTDHVSAIVTKLLDHQDGEIRIRQLFRLGSKLNASGKPRLLKVEFHADSVVKLLLSRGSRLKGLNISMKQDLCKEDRDRQKPSLRNSTHAQPTANVTLSS